MYKRAHQHMNGNIQGNFGISTTAENIGYPANYAMAAYYKARAT